MKNFKIISVFIVILIMMFVVAGCGNKEDNTHETAQQTTAADTTAELISSATTATEGTQPDTYTEQAEATEPFYTREADELEILTPDAGDNSGDNTTEPDVQENTTPQATETFPDLDDIIDEPIELPFVPIQ